MSAYDQMRQAMNEAEATMRAADGVAGQVAKMLRGRLRLVPNFVLVELKRELRDFDAHQKVWKS